MITALQIIIIHGLFICLPFHKEIITRSRYKEIIYNYQVNNCTLKPRPNDHNMPTQHIATLLGATCCVRLATLLRRVATCWLKFDHFQTWANNTQHVATRRNRVAKRTQHVAPNNVAICCDGILRPFGQGLSLKTYLSLQTPCSRKEGETRQRRPLSFYTWLYWDINFEILTVSYSNSIGEQIRKKKQQQSRQDQRLCEPTRELDEPM